jgi:N-methylhydantoinase A/oxoprolinase/acetone carboxylase beta subunit
VPTTPGVTSALGILQGDLRHDLLRPVLQQVSQIDPAALAATIEELVAEARAVLEAERIPPERQTIELSLDARYYGQTPYMNLKLETPPRSAEDVQRLVDQYRTQYETEFGYQLPEDVATVEIVNARVAAIGITDELDLVPRDPGGDAEAALAGRRPVYFDETGDFTDTPIYARERLGAGATFEGPAVVEQTDTTLLVPPGASATVDQHLNIVIDLRVPAGAQATAETTAAKGA